MPTKKSLAHIGFTGTSRGMSKYQQDALDEILSRYKGHYFHHGDCVGADTQAHYIAAYYHDMLIHVHPPEDDKARAFNRLRVFYTHPERPYLVRNHDIVDYIANDGFLIAAPFSNKEALRSGTWATVRYARKQRKRIVMLPR